MMKLFILFVVCIFAEAIYVGRHPNNLFPSIRVTNGIDIKIKDAPWQISIHYLSEFHCSGSIIDKNWVITSAKCVNGSNDSYTIRAGSSFYHAEGTLHSVAEIIKHENFRKDKYGFFIDNIALVRVNTSFTLSSNCQTIELPSVDDEGLHTGSNVYVSGWGDIVAYPKNLQRYFVEVDKKSTCNNTYAKYGGIYDHQFCLKRSTDGDVCVRDGGSPIGYRKSSWALDDRKLIGIISWSEGCGNINFPTIVTEVKAYRLWIKRHSGV